jgi:hypothetical protein
MAGLQVTAEHEVVTISRNDSVQFFDRSLRPIRYDPWPPISQSLDAILEIFITGKVFVFFRYGLFLDPALSPEGPLPRMIFIACMEIDQVHFSHFFKETDEIHRSHSRTDVFGKGVQ